MMDSVFSLCGFALGSDFTRIKCVDQVGLTFQSNLISQTHEL